MRFRYAGVSVWLVITAEKGRESDLLFITAEKGREFKGHDRKREVSLRRRKRVVGC